MSMVEQRVVGKLYEVKYDAQYKGNSNDKVGYVNTIIATMENNNPRGYVFTDKDGMYIIPYYAIRMMQPVIKKNNEVIE